MTERNRRRLRRLLAASGAVALVALAGCGPDNDQNSLQPDGPSAQKILDLFTPVVIVAVVIFAIVAGVLLYAVVKFRYREGNENPRQVHGNSALEIGWTILPALILAVIAVPNVALIFDLADKPDDALEVRAVGKQWWWQFQYTNVEGPKAVTSTELHIPVGKPVVIDATACDAPAEAGGAPQNCNVIHSFWVPELAGKADAVPGRKHELVIEADRPGTYLGQCAEYCGLSHANMRFRVIAQTPADFEEWLAAHQEGPETPLEDTPADVPIIVSKQDLDAAQSIVKAADSDPADDNELAPDDPIRDLAEARIGDTVDVSVGFLVANRYGCTGCHSFEPDGVNFGPNLTHFGSRTTFAGGVFENTQQNVSDWVFDATAMIPMESQKCRYPAPASPCVGMPSFSNPAYQPPGAPLMTRDEADAIAEYLRSLQ